MDALKPERSAIPKSKIENRKFYKYIVIKT